MIRFVDGPPAPLGPLSRREWLRVGGLAGLGLASRPATLKAGAAPRGDGFGRARSVVVIYANGGQSQFETWDPKPDAPAEVRGAFGAIPTAVPGTFVSEHLPRLARLADRYALVRSMAHDDLDHGSATYLALTGRFHPQKSANPAPAPTDAPCLGSILGRVRPSSPLPHPSVYVNGPCLVPELPGPGQDGGFLGPEADPMLVGDPARGLVGVPGLGTEGGPPPVRVDARRSLLDAIEDARRGWDRDPALRAMGAHYRRAYDLLANPAARRAFDLDAEPDRVHDRYGRHRPGAACLLARRLVEVGAPLVTVFWNQSARGQDTRPDDHEAYGWDTHNDLFGVMRDVLLPRFDLSLSAFLEDLEARGLLETTLVIAMGEFGRAPLVALEPRFAGARPGRKHWAGAYSILVAGAGVAPGAVVGASDRLGAYARSEPYGPWDVAATIWHALGIDPATEFLDPLGRPYPLATGRPIAALYRG